MWFGRFRASRLQLRLPAAQLTECKPSLMPPAQKLGVHGGQWGCAPHRLHPLLPLAQVPWAEDMVQSWYSLQVFHGSSSNNIDST